MPKLVAARQVLAVKDLAVSVAFYRDGLGFSIDFASEDWCFLSRDGVQLMLGYCPNALPATQIGDHAYFAYIEVEAVDDLHAELCARGLAALPAPESKPWGMREFMLSTPDGHRIVFGQETDAA